MSRDAAPYVAQESNDQAEITRIFGETKTKVDALNQEIESKRAKVEELRLPAESATSSATSTSPPPAAPPAPQQDVALPPGWKKATTPEGKDYYYSDKGETSWTVPTA